MVDLDSYILKLEQVDESNWGCSNELYKKDIMDLTKDVEGELLWSLVKERTKGHMTMLYINDGLDTRYTQSKPKYRIIAFLKDLKDNKI